jgi:hypothetical protein
VTDWLNGRAPGCDTDGNPVTAPWHNGKGRHIGKFYDGTSANGLAATGVDGPTTLVGKRNNWRSLKTCRDGPRTLTSPSTPRSRL